MRKVGMKSKHSGIIDTLIGEGTIVEGNLRTKSSIRIEGRIDGDIECAGDVTIGELGTVCSNIQARSIVNAGVIQGSVHAKEMLTITKTGKVYGSIQVASLYIAEGGILEGTSRMETKAERPQVAKPEKPASEKLAAVK